MGIQGTTIGDVADETGASVLVIKQACENTQLLVSLCRNGKEWLSPVGWTEKQKITLLDCRSQGGTTEIDIPAEFSKTLVSGDKLVLKCSELDLTQEIVWEASNQVTRPVADLTPASTGLASGLLSRFKSSKSSKETDLKSEAQLRAAEADVAAETYRAKMEAATAAKEAAHRRALDAAREAEAALKMEAERISDMERAAKAFEEAERLKQDGLRRVEEERRQEEARIAEETRRIEEARKREEALKLEAERKAALERYETALDDTLHQETRLKNRLSRLKTDTAALEKQQSEKITTISSLKGNLEQVQSRLGTAKKAYEEKASKLEGLNSDLIGLQSKSDNFSTQSSEIGDNVIAAEAEYLTAQKEAEMAVASAEEKRSILEAMREEKDIILGRLNTLSKDLETQSALVSETTVKTQKLQSKFETAQADLSNTSMDIESLENGAANLSDSIQTSRVEIEATQQAVEDCRARQKSNQAAVAHLEAGGSPENVLEFDLKTRFFSKEDNDYNNLGADEIQLDDLKNNGLFGRVRRNFSRSKEAEISIEVDDVVLDEALAVEDAFEDISVNDEAVDIEAAAELFTVEDIIAEPELKTTSFMRRHSKSLLAIGTILGGAAILSSGVLGNQPSKQQGLTVKTSSPSVAKYVTSPEVIKAEAIKVPAIKASAIVPIVETPAVIAQPKVTKIDSPETLVPNLTLTGLSLDNVPIKNVPGKNIPVKTPVKSKTATVEKAENNIKIKKVTPKTEASKNFPELTTRVQTQLKTLGLYSGGLNGQQTDETRRAIKTFQAQYSLPINGKLTGKFLTSLSTAEAQFKSSNSSFEQSNFGVVTAHSTQDIVTPSSTSAAYNTTSYIPSNNAATYIPSNNAATQTVTTADVYNSPATSTDNVVSKGVSYDGQKMVRDAALVVSAASSVAMIQNPKFAKKAAVPLGIGLVVASSAAAVQNSGPIVKEATAPIITTPTTPSIIAPTVPSQVGSPVQNVVVEAQRTKPVKASYPKTALAKDYLVDVRIVVGYDIDPFGKVVNLSILSNDHAGRFNTSFERAAKTAVKKQKFIAKTVNGLPVASTGQKQRIVFKAK